MFEQTAAGVWADGRGCMGGRPRVYGRTAAGVWADGRGCMGGRPRVYGRTVVAASAIRPFRFQDEVHR